MMAFWAWGAIGLLVVLSDFSSLPHDVGVGTSAYMIVVEMIWIGGMLLFGVAALFLPPKSLPMAIIQRLPREALPEGYQGQLEGIPYRFEGKQVIALTETGPVTYNNWRDFWTAVASR